MVKAVIRRAIKLGSSVATTLDKKMADEAGIKEGSLVKMGISHGQIIIEPIEETVEIKDKNYRHKVALVVDEESNDKSKKKKEPVAAQPQPA